MTAIANTRVPASRTIKLVDSADEINVGVRRLIVRPGDSYVWKIDATDKVGPELYSVSDEDIADVGTPEGTLTLPVIDVQGGGVLLNLNVSDDAEDEDEWRVSYVMHPTPGQNINASVMVKVETD